MEKEEAIREIKRFMSILPNDMQEAIMALVPELAESEDERIKKIITDSVFYQYGAGVEYKDVLDYLDKLEKQKELPMPNSTELIDMWDAEKAMLKEKDFRDDAWRLAYNAFMDGFAKGTCVKFEKQKEQKPDDDPLDDPKFLKGFDTGREVQRIFDEQKPAEWSKEDLQHKGWIEKLSHTEIDYARGIGSTTSVDSIIDKLNEVIDVLNQLLKEKKK